MRRAILRNSAQILRNSRLTPPAAPRRYLKVYSEYCARYFAALGALERLRRRSALERRAALRFEPDIVRWMQSYYRTFVSPHNNKRFKASHGGYAPIDREEMLAVQIKICKALFPRCRFVTRLSTGSSRKRGSPLQTEWYRSTA